MPQEIVTLELPYGADGTFTGDILRSRLVAQHAVPRTDTSVSTMAATAFAGPIDLPDLKHVVVFGDRIAVVIEKDTPGIDLIFAEFWKVLSQAGITPEDVTLLQPATWQTAKFVDPRSLLDEELQERILLKQHDPTVEGSCRYLATTSPGERIYLSQDVVDADVVITIGPAQFDPVLGFRGGSSGLFPGLSDTDALRNAMGQGHDELGPDDIRPLRQTVDEVGYMLGLQFSIVVIPGPTGSVQRVIAGQADSVMREVRAELNNHWTVSIPERCEMVIVAIPDDAAGHHWSHIGTAIENARRIVERDGRIVILSELAEPPESGVQLLRSARTPADALPAIKAAAPPDFSTACQIARAADWANIYLLSKLEDDMVEDLFMLPLGSEEEVRRLLQSDDSTVVIADAQFVYAKCKTP